MLLSATRATLLVAVIFIIANPVNAVERRKNLRQLEQSILEKLLNSSDAETRYDSRITPISRDTCDPVTRVTVDILLRSIDYVDDTKMEYSIQLTLRQEWKDEKLNFINLDPSGNLTYITLLNSSEIWTPDTYFINGGTAHYHNLMSPNTFVRIYPDGHILLSSRISSIVSCKMSLKYFPMDEQTCSLEISSYGHTKEDIVYHWKNDNPVQLPPLLNLAQFAVSQFETFDGKEDTDSSTIFLTFKLKRDRSFYTFQIFVPCSVLLVLAWLSFLVDRFKPFGRILLITGNLFVASIVVSGINTSVPQVSYTKASDILTATCVLILFGTFAEYAVVHYVSHLMGDSKNPAKGFIFGGMTWFRNATVGEKIDPVCFFVYPAVLVVLGGIFWGVY